VYQIKEEAPTKSFANSYLKEAKLFYQKADAFRKKQVDYVS
jgi:sulfite reductase (ferredoxin)